jgi:hypothetical protein
MLLYEPGLNCLVVRAEGGDGGGCGLSYQKEWCVQKEQETAGYGYFSRVLE